MPGRLCYSGRDACAEAIGVKTSMFDVWRKSGHFDVKPMQLGRRLMGFDVAEVEAWYAWKKEGHGPDERRQDRTVTEGWEQRPSAAGIGEQPVALSTV